MIKQARSNATLYEEMLAAGYTDGEFPAWWFSPAREAQRRQDSARMAEPRQDSAQVAERRQDSAQRTLTEAEVAEGAEDGRDRLAERAEGAEVGRDGRDTLGEEAYDPTPPRIPTPKEARPALSDAVPPIASHRIPPHPTASQPASATFSDAELSLLQERGITEITPRRWMHTEVQASGRIMLTRAR